MSQKAWSTTYDLVDNLKDMVAIIATSESVSQYFLTSQSLVPTEYEIMKIHIYNNKYILYIFKAQSFPKRLCAVLASKHSN